jgi:hypothetical protein
MEANCEQPNIEDCKKALTDPKKTKLDELLNRNLMYTTFGGAKRTMIYTTDIELEFHPLRKQVFGQLTYSDEIRKEIVTSISPQNYQEHFNDIKQALAANIEAELEKKFSRRVKKFVGKTAKLFKKKKKTPEPTGEESPIENIAEEPISLKKRKAAKEAHREKIKAMREANPPKMSPDEKFLESRR